ncbi:MAG: 50S ribosomal protein L5 [Candidatus Kapabacteria bacterium]|nr:50S ribosomal protein L5 [Candidatus Kapabacteria bacterium]MBX7153794.1 50S ribosomal protein L5 [Bacteroidota bacterium]
MAKTTLKKLDFKADGARLESVTAEVPNPRLVDFYKEQVVPALMKKFNYKSAMQVPRLKKISINIGAGAAAADQKVIQSALNELELISGQRPAVARAKKSIANFKLRQGQPIGVYVTLRRARMFEFLDRFINIASPRIRDFRGFSDKSFDGRGNYTIGIKEQIIFPEIDVDKVSKIGGMDITFVTSAKTDEEAYALLAEFGFPFRKKDQQ